MKTTQLTKAEVHRLLRSLLEPVGRSKAKSLDKDKREAPGDLLRRHREKAGFLQRELAELVKTDQSNISSMEAGRRKIGLDMAKRLAGVLVLEDYRILL